MDMLIQDNPHVQTCAIRKSLTAWVMIFSYQRMSMLPNEQKADQLSISLYENVNIKMRSIPRRYCGMSLPTFVPIMIIIIILINWDSKLQRARQMNLGINITTRPIQLSRISTTVYTNTNSYMYDTSCCIQKLK